MLRVCWCFFRSWPSRPIVRSLIKAIEQPVSSNALIRCLMLPWCTISITGRVLLRGILLGFFGVSSAWFLTFPFPECSTYYCMGQGLRRDPALQKSDSEPSQSGRTASVSIVSTAATFCCLLAGAAPSGSSDRFRFPCATAEAFQGAGGSAVPFLVLKEKHS